MNIGNVLKKLREYKAISQKSVAYYLNIERSTYARLEENQTQLTIALAVKIAKFYGMEFNYLALCLEFERYLLCATTERLVKSKPVT
ncbi:helix-turn-helix transcriptional regulator [Pedobacter sp. UBA4863]|uniref:helix-turn-helix transcriptional regulator n=1 Tax=Pedobacter sp. UBA4863 TaxID=1947060 RepID=UPI0025D376B1|nr:helix-turn-helix transcriptional regulator [Pedobacter sp. UBA4863]